MKGNKLRIGTPYKIIMFGALLCLFPGCAPSVTERSSSVSNAYSQRRSDVQVEGEGIVDRTLPDDRQGSPHQRFVVRLASGQTVLIQHNIDLAPRVAGIKEGDEVRFRGEYIWNEQGGLIHWTHHDPAGRRNGGWIEHVGKRYE